MPDFTAVTSCRQAAYTSGRGSNARSRLLTTPGYLPRSAAPVARPDRRRGGLARPAPDDQQQRRALRGERLALHSHAREQHLPWPELHLFSVTSEPGPPLDDEVELLLPLALAELVVRNDQQLALVRLEGVDPERLDTEEAAHVVRLPVVA